MHAIIYVSDGGREDCPGKEDEVIYKVYTDWNCEEPCHLQTMGSLTGAFICICVCMYVLARRHVAIKVLRLVRMSEFMYLCIYIQYVQ